MQNSRISPRRISVWAGIHRRGKGNQSKGEQNREDYNALERAWEHMVSRHMYITGGIGSLLGLEGYGNDYELDPEYAYAETCAALASLFWNWEIAQLTDEAKYSDLFEWQLYNAAAVGMGLISTIYTQTTDVEIEINGFLTYDRQMEKMGIQVVDGGFRNTSRRE